MICMVVDADRVDSMAVKRGWCGWWCIADGVKSIVDCSIGLESTCIECHYPASKRPTLHTRSSSFPSLQSDDIKVQS